MKAQMQLILSFLLNGCKSVMQNFASLTELAYLISITDKDDFKVLMRDGKNIDGSHKYTEYDGKSPNKELLIFTEVIDTLTLKPITIPINPDVYNSLKVGEIYLYKRNTKGFYNLVTTALNKTQIATVTKSLKQSVLVA